VRAIADAPKIFTEGADGDFGTHNSAIAACKVAAYLWFSAVSGIQEHRRDRIKNGRGRMPRVLLSPLVLPTCTTSEFDFSQSVPTANHIRTY
jgi:hypothetical protein